MSKVNFVSEFNLFMQYARDNSLSLRSRMLWIALFYIANDRAKYNAQTQDYDWPDDFILVSNNELNMYCCLDKRAIETLRNELKQRGLIDFVAGQKNKRNPAYKLNYLSVNVGYKNVPNYDPNNAPNHVPNYDPNNAPNHVPNYDPNRPPLYKYNINSHTDTDAEDLPTEEEEDYFTAATYARVRERVQWAYRTYLGDNPNAAELDAMTRIACACKLESIVDQAIEKTAQAAPGNILAYYTALCNDWEQQYIRSPEDLSDHLVLHNLGKRMYPDPIELFEQERKAREERRLKYAAKEESA